MRAACDTAARTRAGGTARSRAGDATDEAAGMRLVPAPGIADDDIQVHPLRLPAEILPDAFGGRVEGGRIALAPRRRVPGHLASGHAFDGGDDLLHGRGTFGAEVVDAGRAAVAQPAEGADVGVGEVGDVHVVTEAGAVRGGIVLAEDVERGAAGRRLEGARDDVNLRRVILAEPPVRVRAGRVEVAQGDELHPVGALVVRQRLLDGQLRL